MIAKGLIAKGLITKGLLVRVEAKPGQAAEVEKFLGAALEMVQAEPATAAWFGVRFGRDEYGVFDAFPDEAGRGAHLGGAVAATLMARVDELFTGPPEILLVDVLASKMPAAAHEPVTKGLLLTFAAKSGHAAEVEKFLTDAEPIVDAEDKTIAWFALRMEGDRYGIFDVFADNGGRFAHLTGHVPRELTKHALTLLGSFPDMDMLDIQATKLSS